MEYHSIANILMETNFWKPAALIITISVATRIQCAKPSATKTSS